LTKACKHARILVKDKGGYALDLIVEEKKMVSARDFVYQTLRNNIMCLNLQPGENITKNDLAEKLNVSRTPVGEALIQLSKEELVEIYPQKGTIVSLINLANVYEGKFIRQSLEGAVIRIACRSFPENMLFELQSNLKAMEFMIAQNQINTLTLFNLDQTFHQNIFKGCRNEKAWSVICQTSTHLNRVRYLKMSSSSNAWESVLKDHNEMITAIKSGNIEYGVELMDQHLGGLDSWLEKLKLQFGSYFN
jgi:DNA-binding GntR family transcriptional regulator